MLFGKPLRHRVRRTALAEWAVCGCRNLAANPKNRDAIRDARGVGVLVELAATGTEPQVEHATGALWNLSRGHPRNRDAIREVAVPAPLSPGRSIPLCSEARAASIALHSLHSLHAAAPLCRRAAWACW